MTEGHHNDTDDFNFNFNMPKRFEVLVIKKMIELIFGEGKVIP